MTMPQKVICFALLAVGAVCVIVGFTLMHYIGGFMRTVEEEARERESEAENKDRPEGDTGAPGDA